MIAHCLFEQSGTFKNEFKKLGVQAYDYDIQNKFGETDYQIDLFSEIESAYNNQPSIFDNIKQDDIILAFFPCTRFSAKIPLMFRGQGHQQANWSDIQKLEYSMGLHEGLHKLYQSISKLFIVVLSRNLKMIVENPYNQPHYLTLYFPIPPTIIDKDRSKDGDYYRKPTQFWFINCKPRTNIVFGYAKDNKRDMSIDHQSHGVNCLSRSEIHSEYANRFIRRYIINNKNR